MLKTQISIQIWKLFTRFQCHLLPVKSVMLSLSNEYWLCYNSLMWLCTFRFICMISLSLLSTVSLGHIYLSCWGSAQTVSNCCSNCCHKREAEEHKVRPSTACVRWPFLYRITAYLHIIELWSTFFLFLRHLRSPCSYSVLISASIWSERLNQSRITKWNTMRCLCCEDETVLLFVHCVVSVRQSHILEVKYGSFILRWE